MTVGSSRQEVNTPTKHISCKAVIFDIGGVVMRSPFIAIAAYEREHGIPKDYINCSIAQRGSQGAWQKFERGEIDLATFYPAFGRDLSDTANGNVWYKKFCERKGTKCPELPLSLNIDGRELFGAMMRTAQAYDPYIREAILRIRTAAKRFKVIALTNNFAKVDAPKSELEFLGLTEGVIPTHLLSLFDDFCDSSTLGMRKPEPEFYLAACRRNGLQPREVIFLDDIGLNLKTAKELGMDTIHVPIGGTLEAVKKLEAKLGINLTDGHFKVEPKL